MKIRCPSHHILKIKNVQKCKNELLLLTPYLPRTSRRLRHLAHLTPRRPPAPAARHQPAQKTMYSFSPLVRLTAPHATNHFCCCLPLKHHGWLSSITKSHQHGTECSANGRLQGWWYLFLRHLRPRLSTNLHVKLFMVAFTNLTSTHWRLPSLPTPTVLVPNAYVELGRLIGAHPPYHLPKADRLLLKFLLSCGLLLYFLSVPPRQKDALPYLQHIKYSAQPSPRAHVGDLPTTPAMCLLV